MSDQQGMPRQIVVDVPVDQDGYHGRQCPNSACGKYFKLTPGTGLVDTLHCYCPYCGFKASVQEFTTPNQLDYALSIAGRQVFEKVLSGLKKMEFDHPPERPFGIGLKLSVTGKPEPLIRCEEKQLETPIICNNCTLRYAIYGIFGFCPDCGLHNSLQILEANLDLVSRLITFSNSQGSEVRELLVSNALEDAVSVFDGFGREICRICSTNTPQQRNAERVSFQNLDLARQALLSLLKFDFGALLASSDWDFCRRLFQQRHLLAHRFGIVDEKYVKETCSSSEMVGRKVVIDAEEIIKLIGLIRQIGQRMHAAMMRPSAGLLPN